MSRQESDPGLIMEEMFGFMQFGPQRGVNNYTLQGPINRPTRFDTFTGLYPTFGPVFERVLKTVTTREGMNALTIYAEMLPLQVPKRVVDLNVPRSFEAAQDYERVMSTAGLPSIVIASGLTDLDEQRAFVLFAVQGMPPQGALAEMKKRINESKIKFN